MTRPELAQVIHGLSTGEKFDLLDELWDSLDHSGPVPEWHQQELDRRLASAEASPDAQATWADVRTRIVGSK